MIDRRKVTLYWVSLIWKVLIYNFALYNTTYDANYIFIIEHKASVREIGIIIFVLGPSFCLLALFVVIRHATCWYMTGSKQNMVGTS